MLNELSNTDKHRLLVAVSMAADVNTPQLIYPGSGVIRVRPTRYFSGVLQPGTVIATEEFLANIDEPTTTLTAWYQPMVCYADWPTLRIHESLVAIHRRIGALVAHFVDRFSN